MPTELERAEWRKAGLCVDCGGKVELPSMYIRCEKCREANAKRQTEYREKHREEKADEERQRAKQANDNWEARVERCTACGFGRIEGSTIFCPSAKGTCLKKELRAIYGRKPRKPAKSENVCAFEGSPAVVNATIADEIHVFKNDAFEALEVIEVERAKKRAEGAETPDNKES